MRRSFMRKPISRRRSVRPLAARIAAHRRYVRGYRGGRPTYSSMLRNAWPLRGAPAAARRPRFARRMVTRGNFGVSRTAVRVPGGRVSGVPKTTAKHRTFADGAFTVESAQGEQYVHQCLFQLGPNGTYNNGTSLLNEVGIWSMSTTEGFRYFKKNTYLTMDIVSATNTLVTVDVYDVECVDTKAYTTNNLGPKDIWSWALDKGFQGTPPTITDPNCPFPSNSAIWNKAWKIKGHKKVKLNPGQTHKHTLSRTLNKYVDWSDVFQGGAGDAQTGEYNMFLKGLTYGVMIVVNGQPCASLANDTLVTQSKAKVNVTYKHYSEFYRVEDDTKYFGKLTNSLDPYQVFADARMIQDDDGTVAAVATA